MCKVRYRWLFALTMLGLFNSACSTTSPSTRMDSKDKAPKSLTTQALKDWRTFEFSSHPDWLGLNISFPPIDSLRKDLEIIRDLKIKTRGEAHVTVLSPPEFKVVEKYIPLKDLEVLAQAMGLQATIITPLCLAEAANPKKENEVIYFIVVESPGLLEIRREIYRRFVAAGGNPLQLNIMNYYPHITVGFTEHDLYESDGIIKDTRYCRFDLTDSEGQKITHFML